jgi:hypothetical protein
MPLEAALLELLELLILLEASVEARLELELEELMPLEAALLLELL